MEAKKNPAADVYAKSWMFRSLGLTIALSLVVMSFEWKTYDKPQVDLQMRNINTFEETLDIPPTEQPPPPPPQVISTQITEVTDEEIVQQEIKIVLDLEVTEQTKVETIVVSQPVEPEPEETEKIFTIVEQTATPKGGLTGFYEYVKENINYPATAKRLGIQGRVFVEFVIAKDGTLTDVRAVKGIGSGCDEEAVRIVQAAPPWNPAKQRGKPVRQRYTLPITFRMATM